MKMNKAPVVEVFESIQGEGRSLGVPSIFVRLWGCNLRCTFSGIECDTPYAVVREKDKAPLTNVTNLINKIKSLKPKHIVWTGGEPALYQDYIVSVMKELKKLDSYTSEVETNGTLIANKDYKDYVDLFNISVKLKSSNQQTEVYDKVRINDIAIKSFPIARSSFKFVISKKEDIHEVLNLHYKHPMLPVYLMPEGITRNQIVNNSEMVVELCIQNNFIYSPREHIIIWDILRGV